MTDDELIDKVLRGMVIGPPYELIEQIRIHSRGLSIMEKLNGHPHIESIRKEMITEGLIEVIEDIPSRFGKVSLTIKGKRINDRGGWLVYKSWRLVRRRVKASIFYLTFIFAGAGLFVPIYCSDQERKQAELMNQILLMRIEEAKQVKTVDSILWGQKATQETLQKIQKADSLKSLPLEKPQSVQTKKVRKGN